MKRARFLGRRADLKVRPTIKINERERPLRLTDPRKIWEEAGVGDSAIEEYFASQENRGRGRPRLHPHLTPDFLEGLVDRIGEAIAHLEGVPTDALDEHFDRIFGESWPPHLEEVHEVLVDRWRRNGSDLSEGRREYERRGVALRVAQALPIWGRAKISFQGEPRISVARFENGDLEGAPDGEPPPDEVAKVEYEPCPWDYDQLRPILDRAGGNE